LDQRVVKYSNNDVYRGGYYKGKKEGKGRYEFASGDVYEGYFEQGVPTGQGKLTFKAGGHFEVCLSFLIATKFLYPQLY